MCIVRLHYYGFGNHPKLIYALIRYHIIAMNCEELTGDELSFPQRQRS